MSFLNNSFNYVGNNNLNNSGNANENQINSSHNLFGNPGFQAGNQIIGNSEDIVLEIERKILDSITNKETDNKSNNNQDAESENEDYITDEFNEKKETFFLMKKILHQMQTEMKNPINSIDTFQKFANLFPPQETIKIAIQYLLRLHDVYKSENNEAQRAKVLESLKALSFTENSFDNFNKKFDFPQPCNIMIIENENQVDSPVDAKTDNQVKIQNQNVIKSELTEEMRMLLEPGKIIEIFKKIYKEEEVKIDNFCNKGLILNNSVPFANSQQQELFSQVQNTVNVNYNSSNFGFGNFGFNNNYNNNNNFGLIPALASDPGEHNKEAKNKHALELLRIINPFYLFKYLEIGKVDEKLFTYFLKEENPYFLTALFYKNSNYHPSDKKIKDDYIINLISKFLKNILDKENQEGNVNFKNLKMDFMFKIPNLLTLEQTEKIVSELDKSITTNAIHKNFWYDLLLTKKFKNEISLSKPINEEQKNSINIKILEYIKEKNFPNIQIFKSFILLSLLKANEELNNFDLNLFLDYIENPFFQGEAPNILIYKKKPAPNQASNNNPNFAAFNQKIGFGFSPQFGAAAEQQMPSATKSLLRNSNVEFENGFIYRLNAFNLNSEQAILEKHLMHFFIRENLKFEKFAEFFQEKFLKKIYYKAKIYSGFDKDLSLSSSNNSQSLNNSQISALNNSSLVLNKEDFSHFFSKAEFENLIKKTELNILKLNKSQFKIDDEVKIDLAFKNIQNLILRIYQINTENYYYNSKKALDSAINLEGLIPFDEEIYIFNEKPEKLISRSFLLEKLPKKRGVFIAEFIGKDLSARAIIKKGSLKLITKPQSKGVNFFILDEENKICMQQLLDENLKIEGKKECAKSVEEEDKAENVNMILEESQENKSNNNMNNSTVEVNNIENKTGIWHRNKFYPADKKGLIVIPYKSEPLAAQQQKQHQQKIQYNAPAWGAPQAPEAFQYNQALNAIDPLSNSLCIISHNGFSEIANLNVNQESYTLKGFFYTEDETLIAGNTAKFIAKPFLFLNNLESKSFLLQNIIITASIRNEVNGEIIPTNKIWDKIKLNDLYEFPFELHIPAKVIKILLSFEAEVYNNSKKIKEKLKFEEEFKLNSHYSLQESNFSNKTISNEMRKLFLKKNDIDNNYSVFVLGKNGEAIKNVTVCFKLFHKDLNFFDISLDWNLDSNFNVLSEIENNFTQIEFLILSNTEDNRNKNNNINNNKIDVNKDNFFQSLCKNICFKRVFLQTDQNGEIKLGELSDFRYLMSYLIVDDGNSIDNKEYEIWNLENIQRFVYPKRIDRLENESIVLPLFKKRNIKENENEEKNLLLIQVFKDNELFKVLNDKVIFIDLNENYDKNKDNIEAKINEKVQEEKEIEEILNYGENRKAILITGLSKGKYRLILGNENAIININIHEGSYWDSSNNFIISKKFDYICENTEGINLPLVQNLKINLQQEKIKIKINTTENIKNSLNFLEKDENQKEVNKETSSKLRLHILAYNFTKKESFLFAEKLLQANDSKIAFAKQMLSNWNSLFLPSRSLNEEIQYVFERKNYEKLLGNSLEKPTLLMKRKFISKTKNDQKNFDNGTQYQNREIGLAQYNRQKAAFAAPCKKQRLNAFGLPNSVDFQKFFEIKNKFYDEANSFINKIKNNQNDLSGFKNFLFESSKFIIDVPFTAGEEKEIKIPDLSKYSCLHLTCTLSNEDGTKLTCLEELIPISQKLKLNTEKSNSNLNVKFKDIRLKKALDLKENFTELRSCEIVKANNEYIIDDILSNNFKLIDSLEKVAEFQVYVKNCGLCDFPGFAKDAHLKAKLNEFSFLFKFGELSEEKQKEKISNYFSHEFNFYLFLKFPKAFEEFVLPVIKSKMDKRFIDYFLLKDEKQIRKFLNITLFNELNLFEKCLLIRFVSEKEPDLARSLAQLLKPENYEKFDKKLFDIVIHSKIDSNSDKSNNLEDFINRNNVVNDNLNINMDFGGGLFGAAAAPNNSNNSNAFGFGGGLLNNTINSTVPSNFIGFQQQPFLANNISAVNSTNNAGLFGGFGFSNSTNQTQMQFANSNNNTSTLFGQAQPIQTIPQQPSLFGTQSQQQQQPSLFGVPAQSQNQQSSLFGAPNQNQYQPQQQQQSGLFGAVSQAPARPAGLFSNSLNQNSNTNNNNNTFSFQNNNLNNNQNQAYEVNRASHFQSNASSNQANLIAFSDQQQYQQTQSSSFLNSKKRKFNSDLRSNFESSFVYEYAEAQSIQVTQYPITNLKFWYDYAKFVAERKSEKYFVSKNLLESVSNFPSLLLTLAVLDLPAQACEHVYEKDAEKRLSIKIKAKSNLILFTKKLAKAEKKQNPNLIVNQKVYLFSNNNNNNLNNMKNVNEFIEKEFLPNKIYCHETNIINISYENYVLDLLIQIPEGSIPLLNSDYKRVYNISIANEIKTFKSYFYFAKQGEFNQHGPSLSKEAIVIAQGENNIYQVLNKLTALNKVNIQNILECGKKADILDFFRNCDWNLNENKNASVIKTNLRKIFWLLKNKQFYLDLIAILKSKFYFDIEIWAFAFFHKEEKLIKELLESLHSLKKLLGPVFKSSLLEIDETSCFNLDVFEHREFLPVINNRFIYISKFDKNFYENIENSQFRKTYENFLLGLFENLEGLKIKHYLKLVYYLVLQDRLLEAKSVFEKIKENEKLNKNENEDIINNFNVNNEDDAYNSIEVQCDYIKAYLDFSDEFSDYKAAREICQKYQNFPMRSWKELFEEIKDQLDEYDTISKVGTGESLYEDILKIQKSEKNKKKSALLKEPKLSMKVQDKTIKITYTNLDKIYIKFYLVDLEILFSTSPFFKKESENLSYVNPNFEKVIELEKSTKENQMEYIVPKEFQSNNFIIEISSDAKKIFKTYFSNELELNIIEALGEIKITDKKSKPLQKAYVKCFAKLKNGKVIFFKDGFSDLRGKFNYLCNNIISVNEIEMFSVFVFDEELGSAIKLALPPAKVNNLLIENEEENCDYQYFQNIRNDLKSQYRIINKKK